MGKILAIEPFYGGSHRAFLDGLVQHSTHSWQCLTQADRHWKWRMRATPLALANEVNEHAPAADIVFVSDYVDLATLKGLCPVLHTKPCVVYFHENQFTYPNRKAHAGDGHFAFTHFTTLAAADAVWFNSAWHKQDFARGIADTLAAYPEKAKGPRQVDWLQKAKVLHPGIEDTAHAKAAYNAQPVIVWNQRWEYDKDPETLFEGLIELAKDHSFKLIILGEGYKTAPDIFATAKKALQERILHWGYAESRQRYTELLNTADIVVSTAQHEFFGLSVIEAIRAGCMPVLPNRLSYPELVPREYLYEQGEFKEALAFALNDWDSKKDRMLTRALAEKYLWEHRIKEFDVALSTLI